MTFVSTRLSSTISPRCSNHAVHLPCPSWINPVCKPFSLVVVALGHRVNNFQNHGSLSARSSNCTISATPRSSAVLFLVDEVDPWTWLAGVLLEEEELPVVASGVVGEGVASTTSLGEWDGDWERSSIIAVNKVGSRRGNNVQSHWDSASQAGSSFLSEPCRKVDKERWRWYGWMGRQFTTIPWHKTRIWWNFYWEPSSLI